MRSAARKDQVAFWDELPIPDANLDVYRQIYALEQWLRRIAYAALMARYGSNWRGTLPQSLSSDLKKRLRQLNGRVHLDCENSNNAIWLLTLEELQQILLANSTWPMVKELTGLPRQVLESKLSEVREIRNVIGHNRAIGARTSLIAEAAAAALQVGIDTFKTNLLYDEDSTIHLGKPDEYQS